VAAKPIHAQPNLTSTTVAATSPRSVDDHGDRLRQRELHERFIRDDRHFESAIFYIEANPVRARLCDRPVDWPFSSARRHNELGRLIIDPL
jgi:hypothetical protein